MARNVHQVLGPKPKDAPSLVEFVVCWTRDGAERGLDTSIVTGGTGMAIRLADSRRVPIYNLAVRGSLERLHQQLCDP